MLRHDGRYWWFLFRLNPLKDERGQVTRWYGTATDIEARKQDEDRLQHENAALREEACRFSSSLSSSAEAPWLLTIARISVVVRT